MNIDISAIARPVFGLMREKSRNLSPSIFSAVMGHVAMQYKSLNLEGYRDSLHLLNRTQFGEELAKARDQFKIENVIDGLNQENLTSDNPVFSFKEEYAKDGMIRDSRALISLFTFAREGSTGIAADNAKAIAKQVLFSFAGLEEKSDTADRARQHLSTFKDLAKIILKTNNSNTFMDETDDAQRKVLKANADAFLLLLFTDYHKQLAKIPIIEEHGPIVEKLTKSLSILNDFHMNRIATLDDKADDLFGDGEITLQESQLSDADKQRMMEARRAAADLENDYNKQRAGNKGTGQE